MPAQRQLPPNYQRAGEFDLAHNRAAQVGLTVAAIGALIFSGWLALRFLPVLRPDLGSWVFRIGGGELLPLLVGFVALLALTVILHEAVHGLCFWLFTGARPHFGFKGLYAYAAAPDWYLPRWQHILVAVAPLLGITLIGILGLPVVSASWVFPLLAVLVLNAAGAVGDLATVGWLLTQPESTLVRDRGDAITLYQPTDSVPE